MTTTEHPLLAKVLASLSSSPTCNHHWGQLRREVFPGEDSWARLRAWAAGHKLECALTYSQSSKGAEVQFFKLGKGGAVEGPPALPAALAPAGTGDAVEDVDEAEEMEEDAENAGEDEAEWEKEAAE
jgi:hypothetical protein